MSSRTQAELEAEADGDALRRFRAMHGAMRELLSADEVATALKLLAATLHLGNVAFALDESPSPGRAGSARRSTEVALLSPHGGAEGAMAHAERLLGCPELRDVLLAREMAVANTETLSLARSPAAAARARDVVSQLLYTSLWAWLVQRINERLGEHAAEGGSRLSARGLDGDYDEAAAAERFYDSQSDALAQRWIGLLDVFGFESCRHNSFEQLCINFTNEKLLQLCLYDAFLAQAATYVAEGVPHHTIPPPTLLRDNADCVAMLNGRLFPLLAEATALERAGAGAGRASSSAAADASAAAADSRDAAEQGAMTRADQNFCEALHAAEVGSPLLLQPHQVGSRLRASEGFVLRHYAADLVYHAAGFVAKNSDGVEASFLEALRRSTLPALVAIVNAAHPPASAHADRMAALNADAPIGSFPPPPRAAGALSLSRRSSFAKTGAGGAPEEVPPLAPPRRRSIDGGGGDGGGGGGGGTVGQQYCAQLGALTAQLGVASVSFVQCLSPNADRQSLALDGRVLLRQLRSTGARELVQVCRSSHQVRLPLDALWGKLHSLQPMLVELLPRLPPLSARARGYADEVRGVGSADALKAHAFVAALLEVCEVPSDHFLLGRTTLFLRSGTAEFLADVAALEDGQAALAPVLSRLQFLAERVGAATKLQALARGRKVQHGYQRQRDAAQAISERYKLLYWSREYEQLRLQVVAACLTRTTCAIVVQRRWARHFRRRQAYAAKLQAGARGLSGRAIARRNSFAMQQEQATRRRAALQLQAAQRGKSARGEASQKEADANAAAWARFERVRGAPPRPVEPTLPPKQPKQPRQPPGSQLQSVAAAAAAGAPQAGGGGGGGGFWRRALNKTLGKKESGWDQLTANGGALLKAGKLAEVAAFAAAAAGEAAEFAAKAVEADPLSTDFAAGWRGGAGGWRGTAAVPPTRSSPDEFDDDGVGDAYSFVEPAEEPTAPPPPFSTASGGGGVVVAKRGVPLANEERFEALWKQRQLEMREGRPMEWEPLKWTKGGDDGQAHAAQFPGWWFGGSALAIGVDGGGDDGGAGDADDDDDAHWVHAVQALRDPPKPSNTHGRAMAAEWNESKMTSQTVHDFVATTTHVALQNEYYHSHPEVLAGNSRKDQPQHKNWDRKHAQVREDTNVPRLDARASELLEQACFLQAPVSVASGPDSGAPPGAMMGAAQGGSPRKPPPKANSDWFQTSYRSGSLETAVLKNQATGGRVAKQMAPD